MRISLRVFWAGSLFLLLTGGHSMSEKLANPTVGVNVNIPDSGYHLIMTEVSHTVETSVSTQNNKSNPYISDTPFTISGKIAKEAYCGGERWVDGELLGFWKDNEIRTAIVDGKIYIKHGENIVVDKFIAFYASETKYKNTIENFSLFEKCVNNQDPSTNPVKSVGKNSSNGIYCSNLLIKDKMLLGSYFESPEQMGHRINMYAVVDRKYGILRISYNREGEFNKFDKFNYALMENIINGENDSYLVPELKNFTMKQIKGCFYNELPQYADKVTDCPSDLTLNGIKDLSPSKLNFAFSGTDVRTIKWGITSRLDGIQVASGLTDDLYGFKSAAITYSQLKQGDYVLAIQRGDCITLKSDSANFSISNSSVEIASLFNARLAGEEIELSWESGIDKNNLGFEILRYGEEIKDPQVIGLAFRGAGEEHKYKFVDEAPLPGISHYQLNYTGVKSYEKGEIVSVNSELITNLKVSPNPASEYIDLKWSSIKNGDAIVQIYTTAGNHILTQSIKCHIGSNTQHIKVVELAAGVYIVNISMEAKSAKYKFIKVNQ